jgi:hypothetical protein
MTGVDLWTSSQVDEPGLISFNAQCSPVYMLYTEGLLSSPHKICAVASHTRVRPVNDTSRFATPAYEPIRDGLAAVREADSRGEPFEMIFARADPTLTLAPPDVRGLEYLAWLHQIMMELAEFRAWDPGPLEYAHAYCLGKNIRARFNSPPKPSPDRRHEAKLAFEVDPDGLRYLTILVTDRSGLELGRTTETFPPFIPDFPIWRRLARRLRWISDTLVQSDDRGPLRPGDDDFGFVRIVAELPGGGPD